MTLQRHRFWPPLVACLLLALVAIAGCGSRSTLDASDGGPFPSLDRFGDDSAPDDIGSEMDGGQEEPPMTAYPSGPEAFGPVCRDFLEMYNRPSDKSACLTCITDAQKGPCHAEYLAASDYDEPCGRANDCASINCVCGTHSCRPGICSCIQSCMRSAPDECLDRWTHMWLCVHRSCESTC